jgi:hypothetical protein
MITQASASHFLSCISSNYEIRRIRTMRMIIDENWSSEEAPEDQGIHSTSDILHVASRSRISEMWNANIKL